MLVATLLALADWIPPPIGTEAVSHTALTLAVKIRWTGGIIKSGSGVLGAWVLGRVLETFEIPRFKFGLTLNPVGAFWCGPL
jgi:hypothetical protein